MAVDASVLLSSLGRGVVNSGGIHTEPNVNNVFMWQRVSVSLRYVDVVEGTPMLDARLVLYVELQGFAAIKARSAHVCLFLVVSV